MVVPVTIEAIRLRRWARSRGYVGSSEPGEAAGASIGRWMLAARSVKTAGAHRSAHRKCREGPIERTVNVVHRSGPVPSASTRDACSSRTLRVEPHYESSDTFHYESSDTYGPTPSGPGAVTRGPLRVV